MIALLALVGASIVSLAAQAAQRVDVELVLAVDVSSSMDAGEFELQRAGYVAALRDPEFIRAVQAGPNGRIALSYFEWASSPRAESLMAWRIIDGKESAERFAKELAARPFNTFRGTSISSAIAYAADLIGDNAFDAARRVIDISGDGPNNAGALVLPERNAAVAGGIVINGLPIVVRPSLTDVGLDTYYADCVIGGPGSFVLPIRHASEFGTAIRRKLILEVSGVEPPVRAFIAQAEAQDICTVGERFRQRYTDPYFPELDP